MGRSLLSALCWAMENRFSTAKNSSQGSAEVAVVGIGKLSNGNSSTLESKVCAGTAAALPCLFYSLFESCELGGGKMTSTLLLFYDVNGEGGGS